MHYNPVPLKSDEGNRLMELIPQLKDHYLDLRLWSIRRLSRPEAKALPMPVIPAPPPSEPQDSFGKSIFSDFPEFEFDSFEFGRLPDDRTDFFGFSLVLLNSIRLMPHPFLCRRAAIWARGHKGAFPKLLRWLFAQKSKDDVATAERRMEMQMPFDEDVVEGRRQYRQCCIVMARFSWLFPVMQGRKPILKGENSREFDEPFVMG
jgi:hypothetical protein